MIAPLTQLWDDVVTRFGPLERIAGFLDVLAGRTKPSSVAMQEIHRLYMPGIDARPWHDPSDFPWVAALESGYEDIRGEALALLKEGPGSLVPYQMAYEEAGAPIHASWNAFFLYRRDRRIEENCRRCPKTSALLASIPVAREALFSVLEPGGHIAPHSDGRNFNLGYHLGLIVPDGCELRVASESRPWKNGASLLFDSSFIHEARNRSNERRVVLIIDVWNPEVTVREREAMAYLQPRLEALFKVPPAPSP